MTTNEGKSQAARDDGVVPLDENHRMQAFIDKEQATNTETWSERSPWGGKDPAHWDLKEIEFFKLEYEATQNPLFVWAALQIAMELPQPGPEQVMRFREARGWIDEYLRDCTNRLLAMAEELPQKDVGRAIAKAFGFTFELGRGSPLSDRQKRLRDRRLALEVLRRLPVERYKETLAVEYVARAKGVGESVVGDAWRAFKKACSANS
jgi:hypothetical protein